jgi:hypothetical protein
VAERFFAITLYLAIFSVWLADYVDSTWRARRLLIGLLIIGVVTSAAAALALYVPGVPLAHTLTEAQRARGSSTTRTSSGRSWSRWRCSCWRRSSSRGCCA